MTPRNQQPPTNARPAGRVFTDAPAVRAGVSLPLLLGIVGGTGSGKTFSALRLAEGMRRVLGGDIWFIDTEALRGLHYADHFKFRHVPFEPPFGPLDYLAALRHCYEKGGRIIVVDSMTHEHAGPGGVMDQAEAFIQRKLAEPKNQNRAEWDVRNSYNMMSQIEPKRQRKILNAAIVQMGLNAVFCYRAYEKIKPVQGEAPVNLGWMPETTSKLHYEMTQRFLLLPGSDGIPTVMPTTDDERRMVKNPAQFRGWFTPAQQNQAGPQLNEDMGERMARWAKGENPEPPPGSVAEAQLTQRRKQRAAASPPAPPAQSQPSSTNAPPKPSPAAPANASPTPTAAPPIAQSRPATPSTDLFSAAETCPDCGHPWPLHGDTGCRQRVGGNDPCGCTTAPPELELPPAANLDALKH